MEVRSTLSRKSALQDFRSLHSKEYNIVIQETSRKRLEPKAETEDMAAEKMAMEKDCRSRKRSKTSAVPNIKTTDMYLIFPSYAEKHQA